MEIFHDRIRRIQKRMEADSLLVLPAAPAAIRNRDTHFQYRAHSDLLYLTGVNEEELALILTKETVHVFAQVRDPERERWVGRVKGHDFFLGRLGEPGKVFAWEPREFEKQFAELAKGKNLLYYDFGQYPELDRNFFKVLNDAANYSRRGVFAPRSVTRASLLLHECRLFKDAYDIECMRRAASISASAHNKAADLIAASGGELSEYDVKALIEREFMAAGADRLAYPSIVAAGANATILHYEGTDGPREERGLYSHRRGLRSGRVCL